MGVALNLVCRATGCQTGRFVAVQTYVRSSSARWIVECDKTPVLAVTFITGVKWRNSRSIFYLL